MSTSAPSVEHSTPAITRLESAILELQLAEAGTLKQALMLNPENPGDALVSMGAISEHDLFDAYRKATGLPIWDGEGELVADDLFEDEFLAFNHILPVESENRRLLVIDTPDDEGLVDMLGRLAPHTQVAIAPTSELLPALQKHPQTAPSLQAEPEDDSDGGILDAQHLKDLALEAPIIRMVNDTINSAVQLKSSDIHFEPFRRHVELRFRVDGTLLARPAPAVEEYPAVVSRIKIISNLDIAERRLPQDGRIRTRSGGRDIDIRVSTIPTPFGEDIVLRLLDQNRQLLSLRESGISEEVLVDFRTLLSKPNGILLVTGPTGSGKTTTLYSALQELINGERKIITVEDPVEYEISGVTQIPVNDAIGMTFSSALRSILRHDPDVLLIGEIRDRETAEIAIQASLTGHLVLSTLHTNNAIGAISRFLDMGIADYLLASSLLGVCAQRLVRRLCPHCKKAQAIPPHFAERFQLPPDVSTFISVGCAKCTHTGFLGRIPISEIKVVTPELRTAIVHDPSFDHLSEAANLSHPRGLLNDGIDKVLQGWTSFEEVIRAVG